MNETRGHKREQATRTLAARWAPVLFLLVLLGLLLVWEPFGAFAQDANSLPGKLKLAPAPDPVERAMEKQSRAMSAKERGNESAPAGTEPVEEPEIDLGADEQMDLYGVVVSVENAGAPPGGELLAKPLSKPMAQREILQKVRVKLDMQARVKGLRDLTVTVENVLGENPAYNIPLKPGARVLLNMERNPATGEWMFHIANRARTPSIMILGALLVLAVLIIGGPEVSKHMLLASVMLTGVYKALFPAVLMGSGGMLWILLMCFMFTILGSFIYQVPGTRALSREQSVVVLGTLGGLMLMGFIMWIMHLIAPLDGFSSEGLAALWYHSPKMDYWALFMGSVLIGYQGFLFYLCWQLAQNRKEGEPLSFNQRFSLVMLRGRRLLGPLLSSLFLLFIGLFTPILLQMQGTPTAQFMNLESTASMLAYAFAGGLTLILTVPLTALIAAWRLSPDNSSTS